VTRATRRPEVGHTPPRGRVAPVSPETKSRSSIIRRVDRRERIIALDDPCNSKSVAQRHPLFPRTPLPYYPLPPTAPRECKIQISPRYDRWCDRSDEDDRRRNDHARRGSPRDRLFLFHRGESNHRAKIHRSFDVAANFADASYRFDTPRDTSYNRLSENVYFRRRGVESWENPTFRRARVESSATMSRENQLGENSLLKTSSFRVEPSRLMGDLTPSISSSSMIPRRRRRCATGP